VKRTPAVARIEAYLHADEKTSLAEWCERRGVPRDVWPQHPSACGWLDLALFRAVDKAISSKRARRRTPALDLVCADFGLEERTVRRRWERTYYWRQRVRLDAKKDVA
jgi:hypothetical protein